MYTSGLRQFYHDVTSVILDRFKVKLRIHSKLSRFKVFDELTVV